MSAKLLTYCRHDIKTNWSSTVSISTRYISFFIFCFFLAPELTPVLFRIRLRLGPLFPYGPTWSDAGSRIRPRILPTVIKHFVVIVLQSYAVVLLVMAANSLVFSLLSI